MDTIAQYKTTVGIYAIVNSKNGKVYIGSTTDFKRRWREHRGCLRGKYHDNPHLQSAWNKYGEVVFEFGILEYLDNPEDIHLAEQFWMDVYREEGRILYNYGLAAYNSRLGCAMSEETRRKIGKAFKGRRLSEEHKRKLKEARKKRPPVSEESRRKMSEAHKGKSVLGVNAKLYPAFIHRETGEIIPAGINLTALCRERGLRQTGMQRVKTGRQKYHSEWVLLETKGEK